jgi:hypothetical protein
MGDSNPRGLSPNTLSKCLNGGCGVLAGVRFRRSARCGNTSRRLWIGPNGAKLLPKLLPPLGAGGRLSVDEPPSCGTRPIVEASGISGAAVECSYRLRGGRREPDRFVDRSVFVWLDERAAGPGTTGILATRRGAAQIGRQGWKLNRGSGPVDPPTWRRTHTGGPTGTTRRAPPQPRGGYGSSP